MKWKAIRQQRQALATPTPTPTATPRLSRSRLGAGLYASSSGQSQSQMSSDSILSRPLLEDEVVKLKDEVLTWASQNGLLMRMDPEVDASGVGLIHVPVSLLPVMRVPKNLFEQVRDLAEPFNRLVELVASNPDVLKGTLAAAAATDDFTKKLVEIYDDVLNGPRPGVARKSLAINRSDYMLNEATQSLLQVELNTISSSFGAQSTLTAQMHRQILSKFDFLHEGTSDKSSSVPFWDTIGDIVDAFAVAVREYSDSNGASAADGSLGLKVVLMVVQDDERNILDQQILEQELWKKYKIPMVRRTLKEIKEQGSLSKTDGVLRLGENLEVAVTYLRAGYSPVDYKTGRILKAMAFLHFFRLIYMLTQPNGQILSGKPD